MAIKGDFESISLKNLKMVCNELNDSKLIEDSQKVDVKKNKKKLDLIEAFMEAVESIPEESEEEANLLRDHGKVVEMYNSLQETITAAEGGEGDEVEDEPDDGFVGEDESKDEPEPKKEEKPEKTEKKSNAKKEKGKKSEKKSDTKKGKKKNDTKEGKRKPGAPLAGMPKDDLGAVIGKGTNFINEELKKGGTFEEIADRLGTKRGRVRTHFGALVKCGVEFEVKYKKIKVIGGKEKDAADWVKVKKIPKDFKKV